AQLLVGRDRLGARAGGLAADVEDRRAFADEVLAVGDRRARVEPEAAVGEGVRRDVDDAHDAEGRGACSCSLRAQRCWRVRRGLGHREEGTRASAGGRGGTAARERKRASGSARAEKCMTVMRFLTRATGASANAPAARRASRTEPLWIRS